MKTVKFFFLLCSTVLLVNSTVKAQTISYWDGIDTAVWLNGNGSQGMPYLIESAANLACLAKRVNEGNDYAGKYFKLTTHISLGAADWIPIGNSNTTYFPLYHTY